MKKSDNRKSALSYPLVQNKIISKFILAGAVGFLGLAIGAVLFGQQIFRVLDEAGVGNSTSSQLSISRIWLQFAFFLIVFGISYVGLLFAIGLQFSHRLVGSLMRINRDLTTMIEQDNYKRIGIREKDLLAGFVQQLNASIEIRNQKNPPQP